MVLAQQSLTAIEGLIEGGFDGSAINPAVGVKNLRRAGKGLERSIRRGECAGDKKLIAKTLQGAGQVEVEGKLETFIEVAEHSRERLMWLAQRMTHDRDEAEDIVQEALLKAFKYLPQFRGESQMCTWLGAIVRNTGREWLRERRGRVFISLEYAHDPDDDPILRDFADPGRSPEQYCLHKELSDIVRSEIDGLNPACRGTLRMFALEENSHREAATALGVSITSIKSRICRGKRMLKRAICKRAGEGIEPFIHSAQHCSPSCSAGLFKL
jgi:RNA polymerase sigma-70 factor (ECF subfamily)